MASTVTLLSGSTSIEINGPTGPTNPSPPANWNTSRTASGELIVYRYSSNAKNIWNLTFPMITTAQKVALYSFWRDTVSGPENTFTYTHTDGESYTARFLNSLNFSRENNGYWSVVIQLEVSGEVAS